MTAFPNCFCPSPSPTVLRFLFIASCSLNLIQYTVRYWHERQSLPNWLAIIFHLFWHPFFFFFIPSCLNGSVFLSTVLPPLAFFKI